MSSMSKKEFDIFLDKPCKMHGKVVAEAAFRPCIPGEGLSGLWQNNFLRAMAREILQLLPKKISDTADMPML